VGYSGFFEVKKKTSEWVGKWVVGSNPGPGRRYYFNFFNRACATFYVIVFDIVDRFDRNIVHFKGQ
jgi:hypothetical protein